MAGIIPIITTAATVFSMYQGGQAASSANKMKKKQEDIAKQQLEAAEKAQALLQKRVDESITDQEAAELKQRGLISDQEAAGINALNEAEGGFNTALNQIRTQADSTERIMLEDIVRSGILTREELEKGTLDAIAKNAGYSDQAIATMSPYNEAGKIALKQQQFLAGQLTPQEQTEFTKQYGDPRTADLGVRAAAEESLRRRQKALGISKGGLGIEQFGQLGAQVQQQQYQQAGEMSGRGLQAASAISTLQSQKGANELSVRTQLAQNLAQQRANELSASTLLKGQGMERNMALGQLGATQGTAFALQRGDVKSQALGNMANLYNTGAAQRGQLRLGTAPQQANYGVQGAQLAGQAQQNAAALRAQASLYPIQGMLSGLNTLGQFFSYQNALNANNPQPTYTTQSSYIPMTGSFPPGSNSYSEPQTTYAHEYNA